MDTYIYINEHKKIGLNTPQGRELLKSYIHTLNDSDYKIIPELQMVLDYNVPKTNGSLETLPRKLRWIGCSIQ